MKEKLQGNTCNFLDYPTTQIFASLIKFATIKMIGERKNILWMYFVIRLTGSTKITKGVTFDEVYIIFGFQFFMQYLIRLSFVVIGILIQFQFSLSH